MRYESLDIETIWENNIAKPFCIAITNGDKIKYKANLDNLDDPVILYFLLENCMSNCIYYVHNLTFEGFVFLNYMIKEKINYKIISADKIIYSIEIEYKDKKIKMRCSYRLTLLSLKKLSEISGVEEKTVFPYKILEKKLKKKTIIKPNMFNSEEDYEKFKKENGTIIDTFLTIEKYCKNDAYITKKSIIKYWEILEEFGLNKKKNFLTAARLSVENYFNEKSIVKKKIKLKYDRVLRQWYFGGRVEVFGNLYEDEIALHYDWTGMYAQCMQEKILGGEIFESDKILDINVPGFYWIKFTQNMEIPILPIKREKLLFANGTFEGWYWFEEIILAIKYGVKVEKIEKMIGAQYYENFLKEYIEKNIEMRKKGKIYSIIGKNQNNTFYGRMGMNPERLEEEILSKITDTDKYVKIVENNGVFIGYKKSEKSISNITLSAAITSKARIKLFKGMMDVIENGGRILYVDTDSIIAAFKKKNYKKVLNKKIGEVLFDDKIEGTVIHDAVFAMSKTYALKYEKEVVKIKGFNNTPSFKEFKDTFYNKKSITTENTEWSKKDFNIKLIKRKKTTNLYSLDKRIWSNDLKKTKPINVT